MGTNPRQPKLFPFFPGTEGTRILFLRWAPESSAPERLGHPDEPAAEVAGELPGPMCYVLVGADRDS